MTEDIKVASARAHVLVVEDSSVFREMQGLLLRQAGYAVSGHEHPQTALAAARERKFELVIIDYELPEMNGQQFMHELRKITPDIAIIFVSGSLTLELAIQLSKQGVAGIFNKPANPKTLLEKINETLSRSGSRDASLPGKGSISPLPAARRGNSASPFGATPVPAAASEPTIAVPAAMIARPAVWMPPPTALAASPNSRIFFVALSSAAERRSFAPSST